MEFAGNPDTFNVTEPENPPIAETLTAAYGRSAEVTKYTEKLSESCNTLRGKLGRALDSEHPLVAATVRQGCYPVPNGQAVEGVGA